MPGKNCAFVEGHVYRKKGGYSIFNVPKGENEWSKNWRKQLIDIITKYRVVDVKFRCQIKKKNVSICERHFTEDMKIHHASGKTTLIPGSLQPLHFLKRVSRRQLLCLDNQLHHLKEKYCSVQYVLLHLDHTIVFLKNLRRKFQT